MLNLHDNPYKAWANYVFCNHCNKMNIHQDTRGFFNCTTCEYDNCVDCATTRANTLVIEVSDQNEPVNSFAIQVCKSAIEIFKNNVGEPKGTKYVSVAGFV